MVTKMIYSSNKTFKNCTSSVVVAGFQVHYFSIVAINAAMNDYPPSVGKIRYNVNQNKIFASLYSSSYFACVSKMCYYTLIVLLITVNASKAFTVIMKSVQLDEEEWKNMRKQLLVNWNLARTPGLTTLLFLKCAPWDI